MKNIEPSHHVIHQQFSFMSIRKEKNSYNDGAGQHFSPRALPVSPHPSAGIKLPAPGTLWDLTPSR